MPTFQELLGSRLAALGKKSPNSGSRIPDVPPEPAFSVGGYGLVGGLPDRSSLQELEQEAAYREQEARQAEEEEARRRERVRLQIDAARNARRGSNGDFNPDVPIPTNAEAEAVSAPVLERERLAQERSALIQSSPFARLAVIRARAQDLAAGGMDPTSAMQQAEAEKVATDQTREDAYRLQKTRMESMGQGFREGAEMLQRVPMDIASMVARPFDRELADRTLAAGQGLSQAAEELRQEQDQYPGVSRMISSAGQSMGKMSAALPVSAVAGPGAGFAAMATMFGADEANQSLFAAEEAGIKGADRLKYAATKAGITTGVMSAFQAIPGMAGIESGVLRGVVNQSVRDSAKSLGKNLIGESVEEVVDDVLQRVADVGFGVDPTALDLDKMSKGVLETLATTALTVGMAESPNVASAVRNYIADPSRTNFKGLAAIEEAKAFTADVNANGNRRQREELAQKLAQITADYEQAAQAKFEQERDSFVPGEEQRVDFGLVEQFKDKVDFGPVEQFTGANPDTDLADMGGEIGRSIGENLRKMLLEKVETGDVTENGRPSTILQVAKAIKDAGVAVDASMLERIQAGIDSARKTGDFQSAMRSFVTDIIRPTNELVDSLPTDGIGVQGDAPAPDVSQPALTPEVNDQPVSGGTEQKPEREPWYPGQVPTYQPTAEAVPLGTGDGISAFYEPSSGATVIVDDETQMPITGLSMRMIPSVEQAAEWVKSQGIAIPEQATQQDEAAQLPKEVIRAAKRDKIRLDNIVLRNGRHATFVGEREPGQFEYHDVLTREKFMVQGKPGPAGLPNESDAPLSVLANESIENNESAKETSGENKLEAGGFDAVFQKVKNEILEQSSSSSIVRHTASKWREQFDATDDVSDKAVILRSIANVAPRGKLSNDKQILYDRQFVDVLDRVHGLPDESNIIHAVKMNPGASKKVKDLADIARARYDAMMDSPEPDAPVVNQESPASDPQTDLSVTDDPQTDLSQEPQRPDSTSVESVQSDGIRQGQVGGKLAEGEVVLTSSGRSTSPFPKIDFNSNRKANNTVSRVDSWLRDNAIAEAEERGDEFNRRAFESETAKNMSQAAKDSMEEYLFGEQPKVPKSIFRETPDQTDIATQAAKIALDEGRNLHEVLRTDFQLADIRDRMPIAKLAAPLIEQGRAEQKAATVSPARRKAQERSLAINDPTEIVAASGSAGRDMKRGDRFTDSNGEMFEVWKNRQGVVEAHPVVDGKPVVNRDTLQRFAVTPQAQARNPDDRIDVAQVQASSTDVSPTVTQEELGQLLIDNESQIRKVVSSNIKDQATVDDLVQDVNAKVLEKGWDPSQGEFKKWVSRVARNTRIDYGRKRSASNQVQGDQEAIAQVPDVSSQQLEPDEAAPDQPQFDPDQGVTYTPRKGEPQPARIVNVKQDRNGKFKYDIEIPGGKPPKRSGILGDRLTARELTEEEKQPKVEPTFDDKTREMIEKQEPLKSFTPAQKVIYTDAKGNVTEATVIRQKGRKVEIRRSNGRTDTVGQNRLTEPEEDPFVRVARENEVTENEIRQYLPQVHEQAVAVDAEKEKVRGQAVKRLKINARRINTIEDKGGDLDSIPGFDVASRDFAAEHPEIFGNVEESDVPAAVWEMIKEGKQEIPDLLSEEMLQAAAEEALRVRKSGNAPLTAAEQAEQERQALESIDEFDLEGTDDSFDFGANVEEKPAATIEIAGIGRDGKKTVEMVTREEGQKRSVRSVLNLAKAEKITRGEQIEDFAANKWFHNDRTAQQSFDSAEEFGAAAREAFEAEQNAPIEMKGESAIRTVEPKKESIENNKTKQPGLFLDSKNDLPGQEMLFGSANFDKEKGDRPKGSSSNASVDAGLSGADLPSDVDRGAVETPLKSSTSTADDLMKKVSANALPVPELVELATNLMGSPPKVGHRLRQAIGLFKGMDGMDFAEILIRPDIGGDIKQLSNTLAHEIGHLVDWLPDYTMNRGNILGRIGVLNKYLKSMLDAVPTDPSKVLTPKERQKIRRAAERAIGPRPPKDEDADLAKWKELVSEKYAEFIEEEAEARNLNRKEWINEELNALSEWWRPYDPAESDERYVKYRQSSRELYADAMSVMLNAPMEVKKRAPLFWDSWNAYLDRKPEVVDNLIELWDRMAGTPAEIAAARRGRIVSGFLKGSEKARAAAQQRLDARESLWMQAKNFLVQGLLDKFSPIKQRSREVGTKQIEYLLDELFSIETPGALLFMETDEQVLRPLHDAGVTDDMIGEYLFANRIIEEVSAKPKLDKNGEEINDGKGKARFEILNPLGHNPETARQQLDDLRQQIGDDRFKLLQDRIHHWHDKIIWPHVEKARDVGVYSNDVFDRKLEPNKDNYAAFAVVKYLDSDQISPMLSQQTGTFEEIGNPLLFTMLKMESLSRLNQLNEAKAAVIDHILPAFGEVEQLEVPYGKDRPKGKPKTGNEWIRVLRDGRPVWYEVPEKVARSFDAHDIGSLMKFAKVVNTHIYSVAHPLYVTFSPGFLSANPYRDLTRTWTNLGATDGVTLREVVGAWLKALPEASRAAKGEQVDIVREMLKEKAFDVPFHSLMAVKEQVLPFTPANEKGRLEVFMEREGNYLAKFMRGLQFLGEVQETATKIAGYRLLTDKGVTGKERAYKVRKYVGTPDYKQKGLITDLSNSLFMYSKVKWNALQVATELATGKETAAGYWARAVPSAIIPAVMTAMAVQGLLGDELEEWWSMVPDYDRENYLIIPAGTRENNGEREAAYFRIPMDENLIFLRKLTLHLWDGGVESLGGKSSKPGLGAATSAAVGAIADQVLPSWNPGIQIATTWGQYAAGSNPIDSYRGEEIIPRNAWDAGGWDSTRKMVQWTIGKTGVINQFTRFATGALLGSEFSEDEETVLESLLIGAGEATGMRRLFRISNNGKDQSEWVDVEREQRERQKMLNTVVTPRVRKVNGELARLRGLPDESITLEKWIRKKVLSLWQARTYTQLVDGVQGVDDSRRAEIKAELDASVGTLNKAIPREYLDSFVMTATDATVSEEVLQSRKALAFAGVSKEDAKEALNDSFLKAAQSRENSAARQRNRKPRTLTRFDRSDAYYTRLRKLNKLFSEKSSN